MAAAPRKERKDVQRLEDVVSRRTKGENGRGWEGTAYPRGKRINQGGTLTVREGGSSGDARVSMSAAHK